ncbi:MAG: hypothetical protein GY768_10185 [Planctomycetaceae bacterium]|nr:hypothetical protein [Planctomycetaceae bacterium]
MKSPEVIRPGFLDGPVLYKYSPSFGNLSWFHDQDLRRVGLALFSVSRPANGCGHAPKGSEEVVFQEIATFAGFTAAHHNR